MDEQKLLLIIKTCYSVIIRVFCAGILGVFASLPSIIFISVLINIFNGEMKISSFYDGVTIFIFLFAMSALAYFLWLLSWRALTGKSSRTDGGLMPSMVMKIFIGTFGVFGGCIMIYAFYIDEYLKVLGGLGYMITATYIYQKYQND